MSRPPISRPTAPSRQTSAQLATPGAGTTRTRRGRLRGTPDGEVEETLPPPGEGSDLHVQVLRSDRDYVAVRGSITMGMPGYSSVNAAVEIGRVCEPTDEAFHETVEHLSVLIGDRLREELGRLADALAADA